MFPLVEGLVLNNQELANWFGIDKKTLTDNKKKKLAEFSTFCSFEEPSRGMILIKEVYFPFYAKNRKRILVAANDSREKVEDNGLMTFSIVTNDVMEESNAMPKEAKINRQTGELKSYEDTVRDSIKYYSRYITAPLMKEYWGDPSKGKSDTSGIKGWCEYVTVRAQLNEYRIGYNFHLLDKQDLEQAEECWENFYKNKKARSILRDAMFAIDENDDFELNKVSKSLKEVYDNVYLRAIYRPMRDYLTKKYGNSKNDEWIYMRAINTHEWTEEEKKEIQKEKQK